VTSADSEERDERLRGDKTRAGHHASHARRERAGQLALAPAPSAQSARRDAHACGSRHLAEMDEVAPAMPAPIEEPRPRWLERTRSGRSIEDLHPALEPEPRREGVDEADVLDAMFQMVREQIHEHAADLRRARELPRVEAIAPDVAAFSAEQLVHPQREANDEAPHAPREARVGGMNAAVVGLDDRVDVVGLDREVRDAKGAAARA